MVSSRGFMAVSLEAIIEGNGKCVKKKFDTVCQSSAALCEALVFAEILRDSPWGHWALTIKFTAKGRT